MSGKTSAKNAAKHSALAENVDGVITKRRTKTLECIDVDRNPE